MMRSTEMAALASEKNAYRILLAKGVSPVA